MRPIDADAIPKEFLEYEFDGKWNGCMIKDLIDEQPTIQPEPQEGHWIRTDCGLDVECKCSVCGYKDFVPPHDTYWFKRNYCPYCGAKMTTSTK